MKLGILDAFDDFRGKRLATLNTSKACEACKKYNPKEDYCRVAKPTVGTPEYKWAWKHYIKNLLANNPGYTEERLLAHLNDQSDKFYMISSYNMGGYAITMNSVFNSNNDCPFWGVDKERMKFLPTLKDFIKQIELVKDE